MCLLKALHYLVYSHGQVWYHIRENSDFKGCPKENILKK